MEYETGVFKRYERQRENKKVTQVGVSGLSVHSKFSDDEEIYILSKDEVTQLENQLTSKDDKIQELENQLKEAKLKLENLESVTPEPIPEPPKYINKVIDLQEEINNRNELLFNTQNTINTIFTEVNTANNTSKDNLISLLSELQGQVNTIIDLAKELPKQADGINQQVKAMNWFKYAVSKNKINIVLDKDILNEVMAKLTEFTSKDIVQMANQLITPVEIQTDKLDLTELYISIDSDKSSNEIVINTPDTE